MQVESVQAGSVYAAGPPQVVRSVVQDGAAHVHDVAFGHVFQVISPWNLTKRAAVASFSLLTNATIESADYCYELTKNAVLSTHATLLHYYEQALDSYSLEFHIARFVDYFIRENEMRGKVGKQRSEITLKTGSLICTEAAKVLTMCASAYLKEQILHPDTFEPAVRPEWVKEYMMHDESFSLLGKLAARVIRSHDGLLDEVIEANILNLCINIVDHLQKLHSKNRFVLLDLCKDIFSKASFHFSDVRGAYVVNPEREYAFYKMIVDTLIPILFPHGADDLLLPVSKTVHSYLAAYIFDMLKNEILPQLLEELFTQAKGKECKNLLFVQALAALHKVIDTEDGRDEPEGVVQYPEVQLLNKAIQEAMTSLLQYANPNPGFKDWLVTWFAPQTVGHNASVAICKEFQDRTLKDLFIDALQKVLVEVNPGGEWDGEEFQMAPFVHIKTVAQEALKRSEAEAKNRENEAEITRLLQILGKDPKGLIRAAKSTMYASPAKHTPPRPADNHSMLGKAFRSVGGALYQGYQYATHGLVLGGFAVADVSNEINTLALNLFQKMQDKRHELLLFDLAHTSAQLLSQKKSIPEIHAS